MIAVACHDVIAALRWRIRGGDRGGPIGALVALVARSAARVVP
jgi:hypothetical protein